MCHTSQHEKLVLTCTACFVGMSTTAPLTSRGCDKTEAASNRQDGIDAAYGRSVLAACTWIQDFARKTHEYLGCFSPPWLPPLSVSARAGAGICA